MDLSTNLLRSAGRIAGKYERYRSTEGKGKEEAPLNH